MIPASSRKTWRIGVIDGPNMSQPGKRKLPSREAQNGTPHRRMTLA